MTDADDVDVQRLLDASPRYDLTDSELEYCIRLARRRDGARDGEGKASLDDYDGEEWHIRGVVGEYVVAALNGWEMDDEIYEDGTGDDGYDFIQNGCKMDVKACRPPYADDLLVDDDCFDRSDPADLFISVAVDLTDGEAWLVGSATAEQVREAPVEAEPCDWSTNPVIEAHDLILPARRDSLYGDADAVRDADVDADADAAASA